MQKAEWPSCIPRGLSFHLRGPFLDRLEARAELAAGALEGAGELAAGAEDGGDDVADRFLAGRQLADGLHALVADVDLAVEEGAAELELLVGLLLFQQQACDGGDAGLAVDDGAG